MSNKKVIIKTVDMGKSKPKMIGSRDVVATIKKTISLGKAVDKNKVCVISTKAKKTVNSNLIPVKKTIKTKIKYALEGQTKDTPLSTDPLYKFYTSLLKQNPKSKMAKKWCAERGLKP